MNVAQFHFVKPSVWLRGNAARMVCQLPRLVYPSQHLGGWRRANNVSPSSALFRIRRILSPVGTLEFAAVLALSATLYVSGLNSSLLAQTTIGTGSIVGTVSDPSGAVLRWAPVNITDSATGQAVNITTNSSGTYNSGALIPGNYRIRLTAKGFGPVTVSATVLVGNTTTVNATLPVGSDKTTIDVQETATGVNTEQPTVQGVLSEQQIENLPVNGRNFLDLAQLEPGVQIQDAGGFGFGFKDGFSSVSFGGRFGRTARIEVDGIDISDEKFGSSTANIPASAIQEFQLSQSSQDLSTELTTSGAVNVTTRSGTNGLHGESFGYFRDSSLAAKLPSPPGSQEPFQRSQFGGRIGGPIVRNRLFYLLDGERTLQHEQVPVLLEPPFQQSSGAFTAPFRETDFVAKADYQLAQSAHAFYRFSYFQDSFASNGGSGFSLYDGKNITRNHVVGLDFNTGNLSHSIRLGYLKTDRNVSDGGSGSELLLSNYPLNIQLGFTGLTTGPTAFAPFVFRQSNHQGKYDGSKTLGPHIIRYGFNFNRIDAAAFVPFGSLAPSLFTATGPSEQTFAQGGPFPGGDTNPLNYPVEFVLLSNGLGYTVPYSGLGLPAGNFIYHRLAAYIGASSKWRRNLTVSYGLRYQRETGRSDSQFAAIPVLNSLIPGLGNRVRQPNLNFAPQLGFAWDANGKGKTSIRGGIGLFYENVLTTVSPVDPLFRAPQGQIFLRRPAACLTSAFPLPVQTPNDGVLQPTFCGTPGGGPIAIGAVGSQIAAFQKQYQADFPFDLNAPNPNYLGSLLSQGQGLNGAGPPLDPGYQTPRSVEMNIGIQREIFRGTIVSADFIRNVQTHYFLDVDENHTGDVRYFSKTAAQEAVAATLTLCGVSSIDQAIVACPTNPVGPTPPGYVPRPATMADFAHNGLTSSADFNAVCSAAPGISYGCAFPGINPNAPPLGFLRPIGRSVYNGLQTKLVQNLDHPFRGVRSLNLQVSYAVSRFENSGGAYPAVPINSDQEYGVAAIDGANPNRFFGPSVLDRTHQLSFGGSADLPEGFQVSILSHFWSPLSTSLVVPATSLGPGEIFRTDFTGDGTFPDLIPGTHVGSFDRGINASNINTVLNNYNNTTALNLTPAGQALVKNGVFTPAQLGVGDSLCYNNPKSQPVGSLCAVAPPVPLAPTGQVNLAWLRALDLRLSWTRAVSEKVTIQTSAGFYNLFNFANFDLPGNPLNGVLTGAPGQINGTTRAGHDVNRVGVGTGVYSLGAPRQIEFGLRVSF
jgi:Carboxypeptidase regulatory-like domain